MDRVEKILGKNTYGGCKKVVKNILGKEHEEKDYEDIDED